MGFHVTDVEKPLASVHGLCEKGNTVSFWSGGGDIRNADGDRCIGFTARGGGISRMLAREVASSCFPRQAFGS